MLQFSKVKKFYNRYIVLEIPFLQLENGIFWVKGINGSGKTTLLKMAAGLLTFEGNILFNGISLQNKALEYRQNVGWAEAEPLFPPFMTGMNLISLYCSIRKVPVNAADTILELFQMHYYVNNKIGTYFTGMTKKLSLVLAFIGNSPLIVLDEPLITLDPDTLTSLSNYIVEKNKNTETTFLMSSHLELDAALLLSGKELTVINGNVF